MGMYMKMWVRGYEGRCIGASVPVPLQACVYIRICIRGCIRVCVYERKWMCLLL